jgi:hypothetical protein
MMRSECDYEKANEKLSLNKLNINIERYLYNLKKIIVYGEYDGR